MSYSRLAWSVLALVVPLGVAAGPALAREAHPRRAAIRHVAAKHAATQHPNTVAGRLQPPSLVQTAKPLYSGLIIDASGLHYRPRMSPALYDTDGHNLLAGMRFDPDKVADYGLASWVRSAPGPDWRRTGPHPLEVKALSAQGNRLIFSDKDGAEIRMADAHDRFLENLKVTIIY